MGKTAVVFGLNREGSGTMCEQIVLQLLGQSTQKVKGQHIYNQMIQTQTPTFICFLSWIIFHVFPSEPEICLCAKPTFVGCGSVFGVAFTVFIWSGVSDRLAGVLQVL